MSIEARIRLDRANGNAGIYILQTVDLIGYCPYSSTEFAQQGLLYIVCHMGILSHLSNGKICLLQFILGSPRNETFTIYADFKPLNNEGI